jgi:hypothetical protein
MTPTVNPDNLEIVPGFQHEKLQGWVPSLASDEDLKAALEKAFDYRGDIRLTCKDGAIVDGYLYDRRQGKTLADSLVRILPSDGSARVSIPYANIAALTFSDRDPAAGKSWEAWVRKYWERKQTGIAATIEPELLENTE